MVLCHHSSCAEGPSPDLTAFRSPLCPCAAMPDRCPTSTVWALLAGSCHVLGLRGSCPLVLQASPDQGCSHPGAELLGDPRVGVFICTYPTHPLHRSSTPPKTSPNNVAPSPLSLTKGIPIGRRPPLSLQSTDQSNSHAELTDWLTEQLTDCEPRAKCCRCSLEDVDKNVETWRHMCCSMW